MHEIGHTLSYIHTHSRTDRDSHVSIIPANIQQDYVSNFFMWRFNTIQFTDITFPYEYGSLMHYGSYAFSRNNQPTIISRERRYKRTIGQRGGATFYDYKQMNRLYCTRPGNYKIIIR